MDERSWQIIAIGALIVAALWLFRPRGGRGAIVCERCGFAAKAGTPACPRCGHPLEMSSVELGRLEEARRRGDIDEDTYRRRKLALIRGDGAGEDD